MKKVIALLLVLYIAENVCAQADNKRGELTIIGIIHNGNRHFGYKTLFKTLEGIKPDIILIEQSSPWQRVFGLRAASFLGIWHPGIEQRALQKYTGKNKSCIVLPFDTLIPQRKKYAQTLSTNTDEVMNRLADAANNGQMNEEDRLNFGIFIEKRNILFEFIADTTLERINEPDVIENVKEIYHTYSPVILKLVNKYIKDSTLLNWYRYEDNFWIDRNTYMGRQIINTIAQNKGKNIVVLTGLAHSYFLHDYVRRHAEVNITTGK